VCADVKAQRTAGWNSLLRAGQPARSIIVVFDGTAAAYLEATPKQQDQSSRSNVVRHRPAAENNTAAIPKQITLERSELHALLQSRGAKDRRAAIDLTASESELVEMSFREGDTLGEATTPASFLLCLRSRHAALSCSILPEAMCNNPFDVAGCAVMSRAFHNLAPKCADLSSEKECQCCISTPHTVVSTVMPPADPIPVAADDKYTKARSGEQSLETPSDWTQSNIAALCMAAVRQGNLFVLRNGCECMCAQLVVVGRTQSRLCQWSSATRGTS
jgi:hypothetical protein